MDVDNAQSEVSPNLCSVCKGLDFENIFTAREVPATGTEIAAIGKTPARIDKIGCDLCRIFHQTKSSYIRHHARHVRLFDHVAYPSSHASQEELDASRTRFLSVIRKNSRLRYDFDIIDEIRGPGVFGYLSDEDPEYGDIRPINARAVDWQLICDQMERCSTVHPLCETKQAEVPWSQPVPELSIPDFLIDCIHEEIVRRKPGDQYMTLSYVWGSHSELENDASYVFSMDTAPLTIQDAVRVVRNLGRRYLWVDRYCIDQTNEESKSTMIQNMDIIYERSQATIVALYGDDDQCGLPGVSAIPRITQPCHRTRKGTLVSSCPSIRTLMESSKWNTRAWTYQEARLSQRCLFFSKSQVYFVCKQGTWSEAVPFEPSRSFLTKLLNSHQLDAGLFGSERLIATGYFYDRLEYSKRNLSFEKDILDGFRGVLQRSPFVTFWGVPVTLRNSGMDPNVGIALGLLWMRQPEWTRSRHIKTEWRKSSSRRPGFPTWSWTSLIAEIYQDTYGLQSKYGQYINGSVVDFPQNEARIQFSLSVKESGVLPAKDLNTDTINVIPEGSSQLLVEGDFVKLACRYRGPRHRWYLVLGRWIYFQPDIFDEYQTEPGLSSDYDAQGEDEVLVLIQWNESQKPGSRRLLLMVVDWVDDTHAERRGLLTSYRDEFRADKIQELPRTRKRFTLQ